VLGHNDYSGAIGASALEWRRDLFGAAILSGARLRKARSMNGDHICL
jgi:hypothetical protein